MRTSHLFLACFALAAGTLASRSAVAVVGGGGGPTLDQSEGSTQNGQPLDNGETEWTQTFTAGLTGGLAEVSVSIGIEPAGPGGQQPVPGVIIISIQDTTLATVGRSNGFDYNDTAVEPVPTGQILAAATIPDASLPPFSFNNLPPTLLTFANPPPVVAGHVYAIVYTRASGTNRHDWAISETTDVDSYPRGTMLFLTGNQWDDYGYQPFVGAPHVDYIDAMFSTYVLVAPTCNGTIDSHGNCSGTVCNQAVQGNVQVAQGATCTLDNVAVSGNLQVQSGATVALSGGSVHGNVQTQGSASLSLSGIEVDGNVQAQNTASVSISGGSVHGNVQVQQSGTATVANVPVNGNVEIQQETGATSVTGCTVHGNIQLQHNSGGTTVTSNTWGGNLQCQGDTPPATGQCSQ